MLSNLASAVDRADVLRLAEAGIPVLEGTSTGLAAFRHLFAYRDARARPAVAAAADDAPPPPDVRARWRARLVSGQPFGEAESLALLADYGVPVCPSRPAASGEQAVEAADALGWPVALKTAVPGVLHKSEAGGVVLGLREPESLRAAYADLSSPWSMTLRR